MKTLKKIFLLLAVLTSHFYATAQCKLTHDTSVYIANGTVHATALYQDSILFMGGEFTTLSQRTGGLITTDSLQGTLYPFLPVVDGDVFRIVKDGANGWIIAGNFTSVGDSARQTLAYINAAGQVGALNVSVNGSIADMVLRNNILYFGGSFGSVNGQVRSDLAAVNIITGQLTPWNPSSNSDIRGMLNVGDTLYVGGTFTTIGSVTRNYIAAFDLTTGNLLPFNPSANNTVISFATDGSRLFVGGNFTTIGGQSRSRIACFNISDNSLTTWSPAANNYVYEIQYHNNVLYAGGFFTTMAGQPRRYFASIDATTGTVSSWDPSPNSLVRKIAFHNSHIYIAGDFTEIGGVPRGSIGRFDESSKTLLNYDPGYSRIYDIAFEGSKIMLGADFHGIRVVSRRYLAAINLKTGKPLVFNDDVNNIVYAIEIEDSTLYIGGDFTSVNSVSRSRLAALNIRNGTLLPWNPVVNSSVRKIAAHHNRIYVSGLFTTINSIARNRLASFDLVSGSLTTWHPNVDGAVFNMLVDKNRICLAGSFLNIGSVGRSRIAMIDTSGSVLAWNPSASGSVYALSKINNRLYFGGLFSTVSSVSRNNIAAVNWETGQLFSWNPVLNDRVNTISPLHDNVFIGGQFTAGGSANTPYAMISDTINGSPLAGYQIKVNGLVNSSAVYRDFLLVGGSFSNINGVYGSGFTRMQWPDISILQQPVSAMKCLGMQYEFKAVGSGQSSLVQYQWFKNNTVVSNSAQYNIAAISYADSGWYRCQLSNGCFIQSSDSIKLTVNSKPVTKSITGKSTVNNIDTFTYKTSFAPGSVFNWFVQNGNVISANSMDSVKIKWNASGSVKMVEQNSSGCVGDTAALSVTLETGGNVGIVPVKNHLQHIELYPNPFSEKLRINHSGSGVQYKVYDSVGHQICSGTMQPGMELNTSEWKPGLYFIALSNGSTSETRMLKAVKAAY